MRKTFYGITILAMAGMFFMSGCKKDPIVEPDPCENVSCGANGTCVDGTCVCDAGYVGAACENTINSRYAGTYSMTENCSPSGNAGPYAIQFSTEISPSSVLVQGLWEESGASCTAIISASNSLSFTITKQPYSNGTFMVEGSGTINATYTAINLNYKIYNSSGASVLDQCSATLQRL